MVTILALVGAIACNGGGGEDGGGTGGSGGTGGGGTGGSGGTGGGGAIPLDCPEVLGLAPCGGEPRGSWGLLLACSPLERAITLEESIPACRALGVTGFEIEAGGAIAGPATELTDAATVDLSLGFAIPDACLDAAGGGAGRDVVCQTAGVEPGNRFPAFDGFCGFDTGGCRCGLDVSHSPAGAGPYEIRGTSLVVGDDGAARTLPYCVRDNRLVLRADGGLMLVFERR